MQTFNVQYQGLSDLEQQIKSIDFSKARSVLIQIFTGIDDQSVIQDITSYLHSSIENATIIGSSTAGEICNASRLEESIVLSISLFEKSTLTSCIESSLTQYELGMHVAKNIVRNNTKAVIIFTGGLNCNSEEVLRGFEQSSNKEIIVAGGMAGDNGKFIDPFVFDHDKIVHEGAVAVAINSDELYVSNSYDLSWKAIGLEMTITKAKGNRVFAINNLPIKEIYRNYLGEAVLANMPNSTLEFPLIFERNGIQIARDGIHVDDEGITFAAAIPIGTKVRFGIPHTLNFENAPTQIFDKHSAVPTQSLFIYSCMARKIFFDEYLDHELQQLERISPLSGFFTYGEFFQNNGKCELLNVTNTVLGLSESSQIPDLTISTPPVLHRKSLSTAALIHLMDKTINEFEQASNEKENSIAVLNQYQKAIDSTYIISITDISGKIVFANDLFCKLSGYTAEELIGKPHNVVRHPDMPKETFQNLWETIQSKKIWHGVVKNRHKLGHSYYVDATIFPMLDKDNNITGYVGIRDDITDIQHQKERAEAILNAQNAIVVLTEMVNGNTRIKQLNQKFFEHYNFEDLNDFLKEHECICDLFVKRASYLQKEMNGKIWLEYVIENPQISHLALLIDKNSQETVYSVTAKAVNLETESFYIATLTDVTELENARIRALLAENAKSAFLATMSHELRTPLNAVIGFSQIILAKSDLTVEAIKSFIEKINLSGRHLLNIVNDILDFTKIESHKMEIHRSQIDLNDLVNDVFILVETAALKKRLRVQKKDIVNKKIYGDTQLLKQVLINLLSNAIKFTPEDKRVAVIYKEIDNHDVIAVCDEGIGLSQEQMKIIFEPFSQIREHQSEAIKGTGLGLAISQKIIQMHNGKMEVKSQIGKGSCFLVYLPKDPK